MPTFTGKVVLITGGTSGIGRATAIAFGAEGASVVVTGRREKEGAASVARVEQAGGQGLFVQADASLEEDIARMVAKTVDTFGRLDFAFNNAGVHTGNGPITALTAESIDRTLALNVRGVALCLKHEIPAILKSGGGAIVNTASVLGTRPVLPAPIYNASKAAVIGLTKSVALEMAKQGVRVNAVCPALTATEMTAKGLEDQKTSAYMASVQPIGRVGRPEEIAAAVLYLCSPLAAFTTGIALGVDGGAGI